MAVAKVARNTIILKGRGITKEAFTAGIISPGDLVKYNGNGAYIRQSLNAGALKVPPDFALENELFGQSITVDYASGDFAKVMSCFPGMEVYGTLAANAAIIVAGDQLVSAGDGSLKKGNGTTDQPMAIALEDVDNSANATKVRIRVQVQ